MSPEQAERGWAKPRVTLMRIAGSPLKGRPTLCEHVWDKVVAHFSAEQDTGTWRGSRGVVAFIQTALSEDTHRHSPPPDHTLTTYTQSFLNGINHLYYLRRTTTEAAAFAWETNKKSLYSTMSTGRRAAWEGRASVWDCGRCFLVRHRVGSWGERRAGPQTFGSKAEQMCFQIPPPLSLFWAVDKSVCLLMTSARLCSSQLAAVLSQASSVCWSPLQRGPMLGWDRTIASLHSISHSSSAALIDLHKVSPNS